MVSFTYCFLLPVWYLRFTASDYLFGILDLRLLSYSFGILDLRLLSYSFGISDLQLLIYSFGILDLRLLIYSFGILDLRLLSYSFGILDLRLLITLLVSQIYGFWVTPLVSSTLSCNVANNLIEEGNRFTLTSLMSLMILSRKFVSRTPRQ
jgi:hypothetical protein